MSQSDSQARALIATYAEEIDAIIAAAALVRGAILYTLNDNHFPVVDVKVIKSY